MAVRKEDLLRMIENLDNADKKAAFDFIQFLSERSKQKPQTWKKSMT